MEMENKEDTIAWRRSYYDFFHNYISEEESDLQNVFTPYVLCREIIGKLEEYIGDLKKDERKFLVLNLEFVDILMYNYGVKASNITFATDSISKARFVKMVGKERYGEIELLPIDITDEKWEIIMSMRKFDFIIMNPPYQDAVAKSSKKMWDKFLEKGIELCKDNGTMVAITPFSWANPENPLLKIFQDNNTSLIDLNGKSAFPDVGTTISWYIITKGENKGKTEIRSGDESFFVDMRKIDFLPTILTKESLSILKKLFAKTHIAVHYDSFCHSQRTDRTNREQGNGFDFPVKHTRTSLLWSNEKHPNTKIKKVMFPISSSMSAEYDGNGEFGCSQHYAWIEVTNQKEAEAIITFLNSDIVSFLRKSTQWTASWSKKILDKIPSIPLNNMTEKETYEYFDLNKEEIEFIKRNT